MTDLREKIAEVLAGHRDVTTNVQTVRCTCAGWSMPFDHLGITEVAAEHRRHVAEAIRAAIGARVLPEDTEDHRQYGRLMPNGLVLTSHLPDPTHYRLLGPWLPVDTEDPRRALTEGQSDA